jgi:hypothetical protein
MLLRLMLWGWEHLHITLAVVWPYRGYIDSHLSATLSTKKVRKVHTNCRRLNDLVVLEWIEVVLDVHWRTLLDGSCPKERVGRCRDLKNEEL